MAGPLPHPGGLEFPLPSNSAGFGAKHIPKLPLLLLLSRLCLGLTRWRGAKLALSHSASWPITPATCPWVLPGAEQGLWRGVALGALPACPGPSWGTSRGAPVIPLSTWQDLTLLRSQLWGWSPEGASLSKALPASGSGAALGMCPCPA